MKAATRLSNHIFVVVGISVLTLAIVLSAVFFTPNRGLAQTGDSGRTRPALSAGIPEPPPPLDPPIQTNLATGNETRPGAGRPDSDIEAIRFRPKTRLKRDRSARSSVNAGRPTEGASVNPGRKPAVPEPGPQDPYSPQDYAEILSPMDWTLLAYEDFEWDPLDTNTYPFLDPLWQLYDFSDDGFERSWGATDFFWSYGGVWSAWPAAGGSDWLDPSVTWWYTDNLNSWMTYGPFDFSQMADAFVGFGLYYDTEPAFDWVYFCASIDNVDYYCDYWSGYSDGWTDQAYWLTSYAGYSQVWLAWIFQSDDSISDLYFGPYVDEITVWGEETGGPPPPPPEPDPAGELIENGGFETGTLAPWQAASSSLLSVSGGVDTRHDLIDPRSLNSQGVDVEAGVLGVTDVVVTDTTAVEGLYSTYLWRDGSGEDFLYQAFDVSSGISSIVLNFWFAVTTREAGVGRDFFCASLRPADLSAIWVDLGCVDSVDASGYWQEVAYALSADEVEQINGETTSLVFELYNTGELGTDTAGWVDYVRLYATGSGGGGYIDPNERNDSPTEATGITCGETITGVIGDIVSSYDVDWFQLSNVPVGRIDIDVDADAKIPPSALDSLLGFWDSNVNLVGWNDDDGVSYDSYLVYTNTVDNATFFISMESVFGVGSYDSVYDLEVKCAGAGSGPPSGGSEQPPPDNTWTVMLYLNAEDPSFESILTKYRTDIEAFIGSKSAFLNVAILYDGPGTSGSTRYLVQPSGAYTDGANRWHLNELNMGDPNTLQQFVSWAMDQYPAEHYYLAVDDHGDGAYGISWDPSSSNDQLTPPELYSALKGATRNGARKIDIFDYEACLMGLAENAYDMRQWVDYVVFFEQISWGINTYPKYFEDLAATDAPLEVGQRIVDRYYADAIAANSGRGFPHTISLIDTSKMVDVRNAVSSFGDAIRATGNSDAAKNARALSQAFAADVDATNPVRAEYIDLWDLADRLSALAPSQAPTVKTAVDAAVVRERHANGMVSGYEWDHSNAHGLSIYYPTSKTSGAFREYPGRYRMSQEGTWDEFLEWAVPTGRGRGMSNFRTEIKLTDEDAFVYRYVYLPLTVK